MLLRQRKTPALLRSRAGVYDLNFFCFFVCLLDWEHFTVRCGGLLHILLIAAQLFFLGGCIMVIFTADC